MAAFWKCCLISHICGMEIVFSLTEHSGIIYKMRGHPETDKITIVGWKPDPLVYCRPVFSPKWWRIILRWTTTEKPLSHIMGGQTNCIAFLYSVLSPKRLKKWKQRSCEKQLRIYYIQSIVVYKMNQLISRRKGSSVVKNIHLLLL